MTDKCKSHGGKPIEFCGDQEGWIAVASLSDDSPLSPCYPSVVLLGMGLGESGKMHPSNIAAMLTIDQATDLRERLTSAMTVDRPAPTPAADPLATVRAALDSMSTHATGPWPAEIVVQVLNAAPAIAELCAEVERLRAERDSARDSMATAHVTAAQVGDELIATRAKCGTEAARPVDGCEACRGPLPKGG